MSDWAFLNKHRVRTGPMKSQDSDGFNGLFEFVLGGMNLRAVASDGLGWEHVSVSIIHRPSCTVSLETMCKVKDLFWEPEQWVVQFHPAHSEYVNMHPGCLHLWRCLKQLQPVPPSILVGLKDAHCASSPLQSFPLDKCS